MTAVPLLLSRPGDSTWILRNLAAGWRNDQAGASAENPGGYIPMLWTLGC